MDLREFFDRYGVALGVVALLSLVIAIVPGNKPLAERTATNGNSKELAGSSTAALGAPNSAGGVGGSSSASGGGTVGGGGLTSSSGSGGGAAAGAAPGTVTFGQGPHCRADGSGRQIGISYYMPPCVQWSGGDNGGNTSDGVTSNQIKIIRWVPQVPAATEAILLADQLADPPATVERAYRAIFNNYNWHYETYGREVVFENFNATSSATDLNDAAMIADAKAIADKHPFAVIEGDPAGAMPMVMITELNALGVTCLCSTSLSHQFYQDNNLVMATGLPTGTDYATAAAEYAGKRMAGRNAIYAGDELNPLQGFKTKQRVFGLIYLQGQFRNEPDYEQIHQDAVAAFARQGVSFAKEVGYIYDPGKNQDQITNVIAQLKAAGVTTVVPLWDPLEPALITSEATRQNYFPEWMVVGTGLSDTTTAGRLYDNKQWGHAFGISPLWVLWTDRKKAAGYREYHEARPQDADGQEGVLIEIYRARIQTLFRGIHMAGPNLTQQSFRSGMFAYPPTPSNGGTAALPFVFSTTDSPTDIKDFTEVYFSATAVGPDERSQNGAGMMFKTDNGQRYQLGQWPTDDPHVFGHNSSGDVAVSDNPVGGGDPPYTNQTYAASGCLSCT